MENEIQLSDEQITKIANQAAKIATDQIQAKIYISVGQTVIDKLLKFIGIVFAGAGLYLYNKGLIKIG
jgi:hypothetical protein